MADKPTDSPPAAEPEEGIVKYYDPYEGYGYIIKQGAESADDTLFFERENLDPGSSEQILAQGIHVTYVPTDDEHATNVRAVDVSSTAS